MEKRLPVRSFGTVLARGENRKFHFYYLLTLNICIVTVQLLQDGKPFRTLICPRKIQSKMGELMEF